MVEGETVKIVTHSMGTAFARGYVEGMKQWGDKNNVKFIFQYELDVNAFQGGDLPKSNLVELTQNKTGGLDGGGFFHFKTFTQMLKLNSVPTVAKIPGAEDITMPSDANKGHEVKGISTDNIKNQGNGGAEKTIEQGSNNEKPHK